MVARTSGHETGGRWPMGRPLPTGRCGSRTARAAARRLATGSLLVLGGLLGVAADAQAQTDTTLVSNAGETRSSTNSAPRATSFTTGSNSGGYTITEIQLWLSSNGLADRDVSVKLLEDDSGEPGTLVAAFTKPTTLTGDALNTFTAPAGTTVSVLADSTYWVVANEGVASRAFLGRTASSGETGVAGWTIGDGALFRNNDTDDWATSTQKLAMVVKGTIAGTTTTTVPGAPTGLTATADGTSTIDLSWTAPSSDGGEAITGYKIEVSPDGTSDWTDLEDDTGDTGTTYEHTGLSAGTTRHYRVSAINTNGTGTASATASATTDTGSTATALVSNINQPNYSLTGPIGTSPTSQLALAQEFTTGDNENGYTLSDVVFKVATVNSGAVPKVSIYTEDGDEPDAVLYTLTNPATFSTGDMTFTAPANATLAKETKYFVVAEGTVERWYVRLTDSDLEGTAESGWSINDQRLGRNQDAADWSTHNQPLRIAINGTATGVVTVTVTIEAEHESIGGGLEDLDFTLERTGATTDALDATVTITQDETWLGASDLSHDVTFAAGSDTVTLTIGASSFSFDPTATGDLTAEVSGTGITGGEEVVEVISISDAPITVSYEHASYTFAEDATNDSVYVLATQYGLFPGAVATRPSRRLLDGARDGRQSRRLRGDILGGKHRRTRLHARGRYRPVGGPPGRAGF